MDYQSQLRDIEQKIAHHQRLKDEQQILITWFLRLINAKEAINPPISERLNALTEERAKLELQKPPGNKEIE